MSSIEFVKSTAILTEHLGYAPIALIDDVINAVNEILYKCTNAMEAFLAQRYPPGQATGAAGNGTEPEADEIELGTAKLETYLESVVDKSFDKYELYVLRNIFVIPFDLITEGWIRLGHHQEIDFKNATTSTTGADLLTSAASSSKLVSLYDQVSRQKRANVLLKAQARRVEKLLASLETYSADFVIPPPGSNTRENANTQLPDHLKQTYKEISPITETIAFLASQIQAITEKAGQIEETMNTPNSPWTNPGSSSQASLERDLFVNALSKRAVDIAGLNSSSDSVKIISKDNKVEADQLIRMLEEE